MAVLIDLLINPSKLKSKLVRIIRSDFLKTGGNMLNRLIILIALFSFGISADLFISEAAEGSSNNKYLEIFNAGSSDIDLSAYSLSSCSNGCDTDGEWDYPNNVTFEPGTMLMAGDVYVVCHGSADDAIQAECDQTFTYLSNGDDLFALTEVEGGGVADMVGAYGGDPGSGWDVCGVSAATKDHTLVRKSSVMAGNSGNWEMSAGTNGEDCEWIPFKDLIKERDESIASFKFYKKKGILPSDLVRKLKVGDEVSVRFQQSRGAPTDVYYNNTFFSIFNLI